MNEQATTVGSRCSSFAVCASYTRRTRAAGCRREFGSLRRLAFLPEVATPKSTNAGGNANGQCCSDPREFPEPSSQIFPPLPFPDSLGTRSPSSIGSVLEATLLHEKGRRLFSGTAQWDVTNRVLAAVFSPRNRLVGRTLSARQYAAAHWSTCDGLLSVDYKHPHETRRSGTWAAHGATARKSSMWRHPTRETS